MARRSHSERRKIANAMDHLQLPIVAPAAEGSQLPEFATDAVETMPHVQKERPSCVDGFLSAPEVDPWPEIRKALTPRQFEVFEYVFRFQMSVTDIMGVMRLKRPKVHKILNAAKRKVAAMAGRRRG